MKYFVRVGPFSNLAQHKWIQKFGARIQQGKDCKKENYYYLLPLLKANAYAGLRIFRKISRILMYSSYSMLNERKQFYSYLILSVFTNFSNVASILFYSNSRILCPLIMFKDVQVIFILWQEQILQPLGNYLNSSFSFQDASISYV